MIDISDKQVSKRTAIAEGKIELNSKSIQAIKEKTVKKGDALEISRIAGINAVKTTQIILPMCHQIPIEKCDVTFEVKEKEIIAKCLVKTTTKTGVEMEALMGVSVALNNIWDMVKYLEKDEGGQYLDTKITDIKVIKKEKNA